MKHSPTTHGASVSGFSLAETSIAAGIVSFTLLPLIGLLGLVAKNQKTIKDDFANLIYVENLTQTLRRDHPGVTRLTWHFPDAQKAAPLIIDYPVVPGTEKTYCLIGDESGAVVRSMPPEQFSTGLKTSALSETTLIKVTLKAKPAGMSAQLGSPTGIEAVVSVETPIGAPEKERKKKISLVRID